jgi:hypothetical protein
MRLNALAIAHWAIEGHRNREHVDGANPEVHIHAPSLRLVSRSPAAEGVDIVTTTAT